MSTSRYNRVAAAIDLYERVVNMVLKDLQDDFLIKILIISLNIMLAVAAKIWSDETGFLTTLGFGGLNVATQGKSWLDAIQGYKDDRGRLRRSVLRLRLILSLCAQDDDERLKKVEDLIKIQFDALEKK